ncbi:SDR family NAD(P)-dependent oxidoreductase [Yinghuangia seranimata]|uniref:SDR family NAD(P)-dependent oxidoreductase n=1 Tax=Yinghuangia seranimata TaxID=408067 RepID=UPI00248C933D|nr:SDR family oxidoreductase [Yinghuangia seranimata]MDI2129850.1 SDR family oxidoreductase [Yinghuangia seranimata]
MILDRLRLDGRTVIVSGAGGGGIGTACARALADAGAVVVAVDRDAERLTDLGLPATAVPVCADISTESGVAAVLDAAPGALHGLVNVVGGSLVPHWGPALDVQRDQWDAVLELNLHHVMFLSQAVARRLVEQGSGGSIATISSTGGVVAAPYHVGYGTAKAAVLGLTRTLALEWGRHGIRVNAVAAGSITTPRATGVAQDPALAGRGVPLGRRGTPEDVAAAVLFLISDLSAYTTGAVVPVEGGALQRLGLFDEDNVPVHVTNPGILARIHGTVDEG